jgi:pimeloyl-ACP methyl ester carboxylesterase
MAIALGGGRERVVLSAGPLHYTEIGSGDPIVFVHGVFVNGHLWRKVVDNLADRFRCIVPDWPMGSHPEPLNADADLSTPALARLVAEFLEKLELTDATIVGNDTGGAVCQLVLAGHRERVGRAVLTSCDAFEVYPPSPFGFLRIVPSVPGVAFLLGRSMQIAPIRKLPIAYGWVMKDLPPQEILDSYTRPLLDSDIRRDAKKLLKGISKEHTLDAARRLGDLQQPVLLAWGGDDKLFPLSLAERLAEVLPDARVEVVAGARTFVAEDRPEELAQLIREFCAS